MLKDFFKPVSIALLAAGLPVGQTVQAQTVQQAQNTNTFDEVVAYGVFSIFNKCYGNALKQHVEKPNDSSNHESAACKALSVAADLFVGAPSNKGNDVSPNTTLEPSR